MLNSKKSQATFLIPQIGATLDMRRSRFHLKAGTKLAVHHLKNKLWRPDEMKPVQRTSKRYMLLKFLERNWKMARKQRDRGGHEAHLSRIYRWNQWKNKWMFPNLWSIPGDMKIQKLLKGPNMIRFLGGLKKNRTPSRCICTLHACTFYGHIVYVAILSFYNYFFKRNSLPL